VPTTVPTTAPATVPTSGPTSGTAPLAQIAARINPVGTLSQGVTGIVGLPWITRVPGPLRR
jgi:hypothetical protein